MSPVEAHPVQMLEIVTGGPSVQEQNAVDLECIVCLQT